MEDEAVKDGRLYGFKNHFSVGEKQKIRDPLTNQMVRNPYYLWWELLDPKTRVVHVLRRNKLQQYVSFHRASVLNEWLIRAESEKEPKQVDLVIDINHMFKKIGLWEDNYALAQRLFPDAPTIYYEDSVEDPQRSWEIMVDWFGVPKQDMPEIRTKKQQKKPMSEVVTNYAQVVKRCKGTKLEQFLEDN
jgi:LPS sulfotransferase NodH